MRERFGFKTLLVRSLAATAVCAALVTLCYFIIDRPVAYFVHDHHFNRYPAFEAMTYLPIWLESAAPLVLVLTAVRLAWGPLTRLECVLFAAALNLIVTVAIKEMLKVAFGRYWPETWKDNNPSLIGDGAYGFHPFHTGIAYESFPSGHTARIVAVMAVFWIAYPRGWFLWLAVSLSVVVGLLALDYHFVGDIVAGAFVGAITALYTTHFFKLDGESAPGSISGSDP